MCTTKMGTHTHRIPAVGGTMAGSSRAITVVAIEVLQRSLLAVGRLQAELKTPAVAKSLSEDCQDMQRNSVRVYFSNFGNISDLMSKYDPQLGTHKGFGFMTFQDLAVAQQVLNHKEGHWMDGKWIDCKPSSPKGTGKGGKGGGGGGCGGGAWQQGKSGGNSWGNDWQSSWQNKNQWSDQGESKSGGWNSGGGGGGGGNWGNNSSGEQVQATGNNGGGGWGSSGWS